MRCALLLLLAASAAAFRPSGLRMQPVPRRVVTRRSSSGPTMALPLGLEAPAGAVSMLLADVPRLAESPAQAELPPVYIPVAFSIIIFIGVGLLQASLGDVMAEEADLGAGTWKRFG